MTRKNVLVLYNKSKYKRNRYHHLFRLWKKRLKYCFFTFLASSKETKIVISSKFYKVFEKCAE